ncbi:S-adenosyl-L-methionine-dependent methyltransferase [Mycena vulgaris]|nr:S-adenosyl-L-methionine-dependent methyltransferase [Mycena vulgaris]
MDSNSIVPTSNGRHYKLPGDERESDRLSLQHRMWRLLIGGLYPASMEDKVQELFSGRDSSPAIMDVGCGSGIWAIEMAEKYPNARVVGVDIASKVTLPSPENFHFVQMDLTVDLPPVEGGYDIIHARCVTGHLKNAAAFVRSAYELLKPGGLMILGEAYKSTDANKQELMPLHPNVNYSEDALKTGSWYAGWQALYFKICYDNYQTVGSLIADHGGFSSVQQKQHYAPVNWRGDDHLDHGEELGQITHTNVLAFLRAAAPAVLTSGEYSAAEVENWIRSMEREFNTKQIYMPWDVAFGLKSVV